MATYTNIVSINSVKEAYIDVTFDISEDADLTASADLQDWHITALVMPAAWTAADITFEGSLDDTTFNAIYDKAGIEYTLTVSTSRFVFLNISDTYNFPRYIKLKSSTNQLSADRTIRLLLNR